MKNTTKIAIACFFFLPFLCAGVASAERPFAKTERAEPVGEQQTQVETSLSSERYETHRRVTNLALGLRHGLLHDLELGAQLDALDAEQNAVHDRQIGDLLLWGKAHLIHERAASPLSVAAKISVKIPVADKEEVLGTTGDSEVGLFVIVSKSFSRVASHINFAYLLDGASTEGKKREQIVYNLALEYQAEKPWSLFAELLGNVEMGNSLSTGPWSLGGGARYSINSRVAIDGSAAFGLTDDAPDAGLRIGMSYRFR
jgi:hypothetical protein